MEKILSSKTFFRGTLFFLIVGRVLLSISVYGTKKFAMTYWEEVAFLCIAYILILAVLWGNRGELYKMNIDRNFIIIFIALGYIYSFLIPLAFGILLGAVTTLAVLGVHFSSKSEFAENKLGAKNLTPFFIILLALDFIYFIVILKWKFSLGNFSVFQTIFLTNPPFLLAEEFIFRGLLWKFLQDFRLSENKIIFIQAILFSLCHFYLAPVVFLVFLPLINVLLGYLVSRTKSLTLSLLLHTLHDFLSITFHP